VDRAAGRGAGAGTGGPRRSGADDGEDVGRLLHYSLPSSAVTTDS
jgi:hypothetical protein